MRKIVFTVTIRDGVFSFSNMPDRYFGVGKNLKDSIQHALILLGHTVRDIDLVLKRKSPSFRDYKVVCFPQILLKPSV